LTSLTREELQERLDAEGFRRDVYNLYGAHLPECYVLEQTASGWNVFYSERGLEQGKRSFASEGEACAYLLEVLREDPTTREAP
jgi:hypothetical protein